jgi:hypothetical protein
VAWDRVTWQGRVRTAQAGTVLLVATALRRILPRQRLPLILGTPGTPQGLSSAVTRSEQSGDASAPGVRGYERTVQGAVVRASRRLPVSTTCLDRAIAARALLRLKGSRPTLVIGLAPGVSGEPWGAHAWLVGDTGVVVGGAEAAEFTPVTHFR